MPVQKFRSHDEAREAQRSVPGSETNIRRMRFVLAFWSRVHLRIARHGVFKYRSVEEAQADTIFQREPAPHRNSARTVTTAIARGRRGE